MLESSFSGKPLDIWAAGATLYYLVVGKVPFFAMKIDDLKNKLLHSE